VPTVVLYSAPTCPYCERAKRLLRERGVPFDEVDVGSDPARRAEMVARSGRRTVPQIFIDGDPVGGFEELAALDRSGQLAALASRGRGA
jgi:glutaredoxin 3